MLNPSLALSYDDSLSNIFCFRIREFNEQIRHMKHSRSTIWTLLLKTILVQGILLGLIFVNRHLISSAIAQFTSATTQVIFLLIIFVWFLLVSIASHS